MAVACERCHRMFTRKSSGFNPDLSHDSYGVRMALSISRLRHAVSPAQSLGTCLVCRSAVRDDGGAVRVPGGGYVHHDCTTYRMRQRGGRPLRAVARGGHDRFTGE